jgi:hypothetical protein
MAMGRPDERDRKEIADKLLEWAHLETSTNLNGFTSYIQPMLPPSKIAMYAREDEYFRIAYETAKAIVGQRREDRLATGQLHVKAYDLNASVYDYYQKQEKREDAEHASKLKAKENSFTEEQLSGLSSVMNAITKLHETPSTNIKNTPYNSTRDGKAS